MTFARSPRAMMSFSCARSWRDCPRSPASTYPQRRGYGASPPVGYCPINLPGALGRPALWE